MSLVPARLLYREYQVAMEMDFCDGAVPMDGNSELDEAHKLDLQEALQTLASAQLGHTNFCYQNMLDVDGNLRLIDYDAMQIIPGGTTAKNFYAALIKSESNLQAESLFTKSVISVLEGDWQ